MKKFLAYILALPLAILLTSCVKENEFNDNATGNFDALWNIIDERYCFFDHAAKEFGLDWDAVYQKYRPAAMAAGDEGELFDILGEMLRELRDGHVNLTSYYGTTYYWDWNLNHPLNFSDSLQRNYLGNDFRYTNGIKYTLLPDEIAYVYIESFANGLNSNNISVMLKNISSAKGLILDIRNNGGGQLTSAEQLAGHFVLTKTHCGYIQHKTGKGHNDFSSPEPLYIEPQGSCWGKPVVLLTNRGVYSAANHFVMLMKPLPQVYVIGDTTGGGSGLPLNSTLPNGWTVRFSACPILDIEGKHTEFGIAPHKEIHLSSEDWNNGHDTMIEEGRRLIHLVYENISKKD